MSTLSLTKSLFLVPVLALAQPAFALEVTIQNCYYDGQTHEFVVAAESATPEPENVHTYVNIPFKQNQTVHCNNPDSQKACAVWVDGAKQRWVSVKDSITWYASGNYELAIDSSCSGG